MKMNYKFKLTDLDKHNLTREDVQKKLRLLDLRGRQLFKCWDYYLLQNDNVTPVLNGYEQKDKTETADKVTLHYVNTKLNLVLQILRGISK